VGATKTDCLRTGIVRAVSPPDSTKASDLWSAMVMMLLGAIIMVALLGVIVEASGGAWPEGGCCG